MSRAAAGAFTLGVALMLLFDSTTTRILGVALIFAGIALGAWSIATPEFTQDED